MPRKWCVGRNLLSPAPHIHIAAVPLCNSPGPLGTEASRSGRADGIVRGAKTPKMNSFMKPELRAAFLVLVVVVLVVVVLVLVRRGRAHARRAARLERQLVAIDRQCRVMRLHPHVVFNTLHAISTLIDIRPDDAKRCRCRRRRCR